MHRALCCWAAMPGLAPCRVVHEPMASDGFVEDAERLRRRLAIACYVGPGL